MSDVEIREIFCRPTDERALLSYCFSDIDKFYDLCSKLSADTFLYTDNSTLFTLFTALEKEGVSSFDLPMVINVANTMFGGLSSIGGIEYVQSIKDMRLSNSNFDIYLKNVLEAHTKYKLYCILHDDLDKIKNNSKSGITGEELIGSSERKILDLSTSSKAINEPKNMSEGLRAIIDRRKENPVDQVGLPTGYHILDRQIDGLVPGTLNIISARPKMGKSSLLSNIATFLSYVTDETVPILYVDTEMSFSQVQDRIMANMSGVPERIIKHGGYSSEDYSKLVRVVDIIEKGKLFHEYMPGYSIDKLTTLYKKYKLKHGIGLMIFDYIKEPISTSLSAQRKEYQILGDVTTSLKDLCGSLDIPCLAAVQVNREGAVADSDKIVRYADTIMEWTYKTQEEIETKGIVGGQYKLVIRETRRGGMTPKEGIGYLFKKSILSIKEAEPPDQIIDYSNKIVNYGDSGDDTIL
jgi:replicative DNA helicase